MTLRERNLARLNEGRLREIFAVLVDNCGAALDDEECFIDDFTWRPDYYSASQPWSCGGYLDGTGGFYFGDDGIPAICCRLGDLDPETQRMLVGVHRLYLELAERWKNEDRRGRAREYRARRSAERKAVLEAKQRERRPRERLSALAAS